MTYSTRARSSPKTDDLKFDSVRSKTSDASAVAKNGRRASNAPENFIFWGMYMGKYSRCM